MGDLVEKQTTDVVEYRRGVPLREVAKGVLTRFLPGSVAGMGLALGGATLVGPALPLLGILAEWAGQVGIGFAVGMVVLSRWLFPDAKVSGARGVIAGVLAPLLPLFYLWLNAVLGTGVMLTPREGALLFMLGGFIAAVAMFFPWLTETPEHMRDTTEQRSEAAPNRQVSGGAT